MTKSTSGFNSYKNASRPDSKSLPSPTKIKSIADRVSDPVKVIRYSDLKSKRSPVGKSHPFSEPKNSPIRVPLSAKVSVKKKEKYVQVKYTWKNDKYKYESRWHTPTPKSPMKKQSWVVIRTKLGKGYGKNPRNARVEVLSGKRWVNWSTWKSAIVAKNNGTAIAKQTKMLSEGHFTRKKNK